MTGIWGTRVANETTRDADVILAVGTALRRSRLQFVETRIHLRHSAVEADPDRHRPAGDRQDLSGRRRHGRRRQDRSRVTERASPAIRGRSGRRAARAAQLHSARKRVAAELTASQAGRRQADSSRASAARNREGRCPTDAIFVTDVGWNKNGAGQQLAAPASAVVHHQRRPRDDGIRAGGRDWREDWPAPDRPVIALVGDGGFMSVCGALTTAVELGIPVVWILFNNFCFSTIRTVGVTYFKNAYGTEFTTPGRRAVQPRLSAARQGVRHRAARVDRPADLPAR